MTAGKGDKQRPTDMQKFGQNYDNIFKAEPTPVPTMVTSDNDNRSTKQNDAKD